MAYIICNNDNYINRDKKNHFNIVSSMDKATKWNDITKAIMFVKII